ncbi:hypothetical protein AA0535_2739 [Asaia krungthepensis NRIC 0535]|uniref:Uncharacterized protein n=1 Tax=Asaia krungthepensis NRIC 0535 TaxID=1307925 RepID=A0ABQ0Q619_9PROT|nr:hypothetical protein AA0535_2739 [Asaia krungthepensis NRIC 0535]
MILSYQKRFDLVALVMTQRKIEDAMRGAGFGETSISCITRIRLHAPGSIEIIET